MPKLEYFIVCESICTDIETNRLSLFNVIEELRRVPPGTPVPGHLVAQMTAVCCWNREQEDEGKDFSAVLRVQDPSGKATDLRMNFRMERPRHRLSFRIQGVPASMPGELKFELLLNDKHVAQHVVAVHEPESSTSATNNRDGGTTGPTA